MKSTDKDVKMEDHILRCIIIFFFCHTTPLLVYALIAVRYSSYSIRDSTGIVIYALTMSGLIYGTMRKRHVRAAYLAMQRATYM